MSSMNEFEEDLAEIKSHMSNARRIFWTGANPFAMNYENLRLRALTVRDYLIKCQSIAMFASILDIKSKSVEQLRKLRAMGINGLSIGTESADNDTLSLANKGYTAEDIIEQCKKLDEAGIEYYFVYMTGLAGKGNSRRNAMNSAKVFNQLNPFFLGVDSLTLFPGTELFTWAQSGKFIPAGEYERIEELIMLLENLQIRVHIQADTKSNYLPLAGTIPYDKDRMIGKLRSAIATVSEQDMLTYRNGLDSL